VSGIAHDPFLRGAACSTNRNALINKRAANLAGSARTLGARAGAELARIDGSEAVLGVRAAVGAQVAAGGDAGGARGDTDLGQRATDLTASADRGVSSAAGLGRGEAVASVGTAVLVCAASALARDPVDGVAFVTAVSLGLASVIMSVFSVVREGSVNDGSNSPDNAAAVGDGVVPSFEFSVEAGLEVAITHVEFSVGDFKSANTGRVATHGVGESVSEVSLDNWLAVSAHEGNHKVRVVHAVASFREAKGDVLGLGGNSTEAHLKGFVLFVSVPFHGEVNSSTKKLVVAMVGLGRHGGAKGGEEKLHDR
jgi:hypothetical protein